MAQTNTRPKMTQALTERLESLEKSQAQLSSIVEYIPNYVHAVDLDLRVTYINRLPSAMKQSVVGTMVGDFMPPADRKRIRQRLRGIIATGKPAEYEFRGQGANDTMAWYRQSAGPVKEHGVITGLILITYDITADKLRTEALTESKRRAGAARAYDQALLNSIGEGLIVVDERGQIANINPIGATMLGYKPKEIIGQWFPRVVRALDGEDRVIDLLDRPAMRALSEGKAVSEHVQYERRDGSRFPAAVTISPVVLKGKPVGAVEVFRDLTHERQLEQAKEDFVSIASHQLRTPATGVKAYISMLLDGYGGKLTEQQADFLQRVFDSNERQLKIVNDLLNVARADAGQIVPKKVRACLSATVEMAASELQAQIHQRNQALECILPKSESWGEFDPALVGMAIENLISNASKYTHDGGSIRLELTAGRDEAVIAVSDTGVGIPKNDLASLFKRFSRIDNVLSTSSGGSGLGLYFTQTIVDLHGGSIVVDSKVDEGTTFRITLPLVEVGIGN